MTLGKHLKGFGPKRFFEILSRSHQSLPASLSALKLKAHPKNDQKSSGLSFAKKNQVDWQKITALVSRDNDEVQKNDVSVEIQNRMHLKVLDKNYKIVLIG